MNDDDVIVARVVDVVIVAMVRAGYPQGIPAADGVALVAFRQRMLSDDEIEAVAADLATHGEAGIDPAGIGALLAQIAHDTPLPDEVGRVQRRLEAIGWPTDPD